MSFNSRSKPYAIDTGSTAVTAVAAGTTVTATHKVQVQNVALGSVIAAQCAMGVKTSSLTLAPKVQGSHDGTNWDDCYEINSVANVATAAGTGSLVTTTRTLLIPVIPYKYVRVAFLTAGATAHATDDVFRVKYSYIQSTGY